MFKYLLALSLTAAPLAAQEVPPFQASQACGTFAVMAEQTKKYNEQILFKGEILQQHMSGQMVRSEMVFMTNQDTGSWTLVSLFPNGWACMVANGSKFEPYLAK